MTVEDKPTEFSCTLLHIHNKYRLYTEVQVSTLFTQPRDKGPRLCKLRRDRTEVYNGLVPWAYVALTRHPHGSNNSAGYKSQLEQHPATQQNISNRHDRESRLVFYALTVSSWPSLYQAFKKAKMLRTSTAMAFLLASASTKHDSPASISLYSCLSSKIRGFSIQLLCPLMAINLQPHHCTYE